jgi:general secretion pathway protein B
MSQPPHGKRPPGLGKELPERESPSIPAGAAPPKSDANASANLQDGPNRALADAMRTRMKAKKDAADDASMAAKGDLKSSPAQKPDKIPMPDTGPTTQKADATAAIETLPPGTKKPEPAPGTPKAEPPAGAPHDAEKPTAIAAGSKPKSDEPPMSWQLPYNVRKDLPALNVTMHVFSADPAKRFVVINGDRKAEGDTLGTDVNLREIRIDGIVLEFHGQKFLVPRGGT